MSLTSPPLTVVTAIDPERIKQAFAALHYLETHGDNVKRAIDIAIEHAEVVPPDIDDKSYWRHEQRALSQAVDPSNYGSANTTDQQNYVALLESFGLKFNAEPVNYFTVPPKDATVAIAIASTGPKCEAALDDSSYKAMCFDAAGAFVGWATESFR
jgi:hypothetical protein